MNPKLTREPPIINKLWAADAKAKPLPGVGAISSHRKKSPASSIRPASRAAPPAAMHRVGKRRVPTYRNLSRVWLLTAIDLRERIIPKRNAWRPRVSAIVEKKTGCQRRDPTASPDGLTKPKID